MTDFPKDVFAAAEKIMMEPIADNDGNCLAYYVGPYTHKAVSVIARAIMAERARCAQVALDHRYMDTDVASIIAIAIRTPTEPQLNTVQS